MKPTYQTATATTQTRLTGTVKFFDRLKGWGFIEPDNGSDEVFVHYTGIDGDGYRNIYDGDLVSYILVDRGRGPQAQSLREGEHDDLIAAMQQVEPGSRAATVIAMMRQGVKETAVLTLDEVAAADALENLFF